LIRRTALPAGSGVTHYLTNGDLAAFKANVRDWTRDYRGTFAATQALAS
jgi:hypothetical protein